MGIHLDLHEVEQVTARTEGWVMGLQLVGLSLRGQSTPHTFLM
jgi:ATP/maltotriose-dependent transcriptional regulator MalT